MGYRSKVIMGVKTKYVKGLEDILIDCNFDVKKDNHYLTTTFDDDDDMKIYQMDYVKWYGYGEDDFYKKIEDYIDKAYEDNDNAFLVAMGEDGAIHTEIGDYWEYVDVIRDIELIQ
tara:strand:- start:2784 stop:3131 length:348 start_codon:yes stop_codon:yes gene_type:complete